MCNKRTATYCLSVPLFVHFSFSPIEISVTDFSAPIEASVFKFCVHLLKFGTKLDSDELYCVSKEQPHIAYQSIYSFFFLSNGNSFFSVKDFSAPTWVRILKFCTKLDCDELYCVTKEQPHIAYQSLYLFIILSLQLKFLSQISQLLLKPVFLNLVYTFRKAKCTVLLEIKMLILILPSFFIFSFFHSYKIHIDIFFCQRFLSTYFG